MARELILRETEVVRPPLCPELELHLVTDACRLWSATEAELEALGLPAPFWGFCWAGGQALARYVLDHPAAVKDRAVLDFGSGCAVEAIAAARSGARAVLAADIDPLAAEAAALNAARNGVSLDVTTEDLLGEDRGWGVVLVGDMFYEAALAGRIAEWLSGLARRGAEVLLGDPHRGFLPATGLEPLAEYQAPSDVDVRGQYLRRTTVFRFAR